MDLQQPKLNSGPNKAQNISNKAQNMENNKNN